MRRTDEGAREIAMSTGRPSPRALTRTLLALLIAAPLFTALADVGGPQTVYSVTLHDLDPKRLPTQLDEDTDPGDVSVSHRVAFAPGAGQGPGLARRTRMRGVHAGAGQSESLLVPTLGTVSGSLLVAVDSTDGLVHGLSLGYLERRLTAGDAPVRVEAIWNQTIDGLTLRARVGDEQLGELLNLPGERQATLTIGVDASDVMPKGAGASASIDFGIVFQAGGPTATWAWGCADLGAGGSFWFSQLRLESFGYGGVDIGGVEQDVLAWTWSAWTLLDLAAAQLEESPPHDLHVVHVLLDDALLQLQFSVVGTLQPALQQGTLQPGTPGAAVLSLAKRATKATAGADMQAFKLHSEGATDGTALQGRVQKAQRLAERLMARLLGCPPSSYGGLVHSAELAAE